MFYLYLLGAIAVIGVAMVLVAGVNRLSALTSFKFQATFKDEGREDGRLEERPPRRLSSRRGRREETDS